MPNKVSSILCSYLEKPRCLQVVFPYSSFQSSEQTVRQDPEVNTCSTAFLPLNLTLRSRRTTWVVKKNYWVHNRCTTVSMQHVDKCGIHISWLTEFLLLDFFITWMLWQIFLCFPLPLPAPPLRKGTKAHWAKRARRKKSVLMGMDGGC